MPGFDHSAAPPPEKENAKASAQRAYYGRILFFFYLLLYGGFVFLNAFAPQAMEQTPFMGINLAILYGLGLIAVAFVLALLYDWLCRFIDARQAREDRR
jgi:uncharacterized membrane protein (DUF485 family)